MDNARSRGKNSLKINCANPNAQFLSHQNEIEAAVLAVLRGEKYILGNEVSKLEKEFANYIGVEEAIGVANGTDALEISLRALGIESGDEVITVSHTAVATVAAIEAAGATAVVVDIDASTFTMDPNQLSEVLTSKTKVVVAVHIYGHPADIDAIQLFCKIHNLKLVEDVSQAHGAKWNNRRLGSIGDISCFSCYPTKNLGAIGDAGLITTNDKKLASKVRMIREYGWRDRYVSDIVGRNSRLDEIQAAILRVKLRTLDSDNKKRKEIADYYTKAFKHLPLTVPIEQEGAEAVYHLYVIKCKDRNLLKNYLIANGIQPGIHYPLPIHLQPAYKNRIRTSIKMSNTEEISNQVLSLPMYPELTESELEKVTQSIISFYRETN